MKIINCIKWVVIILILFVKPAEVTAAIIKSGESVYISEEEKNLSDLYIFGSTITADAAVGNDLTAAGGVITLNGDVAGSIFAAGGDVFIRSKSANTLRALGGNIIISGKVGNDALLAGGNIRLTETASIEGDLLIFGGDIQINSPVKGKLYVYGGNVVINNKILGSVEGNMGNLTLGSKALIAGDLKYSSDKKAVLNTGASVKGMHDFRKVEYGKDQENGFQSIFKTGTLYKLGIDIIICLLLLTFLPFVTKRIFEDIINNPLGSLGVGFVFLAFWPFFSIVLLLLLFLGVLSFLYYGIVLTIALFIGKLFLGWWILVWWGKRNTNEYILDWKAAVVGPLITFILFLIPIIGWLAAGLVYITCVGGIVKFSINLARMQKQELLSSKKIK